MPIFSFPLARFSLVRLYGLIYFPCIQFLFFFNLKQHDHDCITKFKTRGKEELVLYYSFSFIPILLPFHTLTCIQIIFPRIFLQFHTGKVFTLSPNVGIQCTENTFTSGDTLAVLDYYFHAK